VRVLRKHPLEPRVDGWTREGVLVQHVAQVQAGVAEGVSVVGYLPWSLTDNYEWGSHTPRFGLYRVDVLTDQRLIRHATAAVAVYRRITRHREMTAALLAQYPRELADRVRDAEKIGRGTASAGA
jgi:beta-glucosidase